MQIYKKRLTLQLRTLVQCTLLLGAICNEVQKSDERLGDFAMLKKHKNFNRILILLVPIASVISGCTKSVVEFDNAQIKTMEAPKSAWGKNITADNTYFAYAAKFIPSANGRLSCKKGNGTPFSDFKQSYSLILSPTENKSNFITKGDTPQPVITFESNKSSCKGGSFNHLLTPYKKISKTTYLVNRVDISDEELKIDYNSIYSFSLNISQLALTASSGGAANLVPLLDNDLNRDAYSKATQSLNSQLSQWLKNSSTSFYTIDKPLVEVGERVIVFNELSIPVSVIDGNNPPVNIGHVKVYPEFKRTVWIDPAQANKIDDVTIDDVKNRDLGRVQRAGFTTAQTYGEYLNAIDNSEISINALKSIGKGIDWKNVDPETLIAEKDKLLRICLRTSEVIEDEGMHIYDKQLFLAKRMEHSPLWIERIKELPSIPPKNSMVEKKTLDIMTSNANEINKKKSIDLTNCLDQGIQKSLNNPIFSSDQVNIYLDRFYDRKHTLVDGSLINYFNNKVWYSLKRQANFNDNEKENMYENRYVEILYDTLLTTDRDAKILFEDNRRAGNEDWFGKHKIRLSATESFRRLWDIELYLYGCFLQPIEVEVDKVQLNSDSVQMLYLSHDGEVGTIIFNLPHSKSNGGIRQLKGIELNPLYSSKDQYLNRIEESGFSKTSNCMENVYPNALGKLADN
ncbi:hypothetical protein [Vibrio splendidus]|uniref:hypothetical protein n=1 Tax=Vibrio splendidus TaxID=29497 RepID=UPI0011B25A79|nr:hypothetical protein [Vibrio splendidus]